jgi:hypothetical protein
MQQKEAKDSLPDKLQPRQPRRLAGVRRVLTRGLLLISMAASFNGSVVPPSTFSVSTEDQSTSATIEPTPTLQISITPSPDVPTSIPAATLSPAPESTPTPTPEARQPKVLSEVNTGYGSEPSVSVSPYNKNLVAVSYNWVPLDGSKQAGVRISQDGGKTWKEVAKEPWKGQGYPDYHGVIAWGPGETLGSSRLWWVDAMVRGSPTEGVKDRYQTVAYSDDLGKNWNFHVFKDTPPWIGGFPNLTVDNNPQSPNFGTTYVAYNWLESEKGPGLAVAASKDGKNWQVAQVPAPEEAGYPDYWRINFKPKATSNGVDVIFYQTNTKKWNENDPFSEGRKGETAYYLAQLSFDENAKFKVDNVLPTTDLQRVSWGSVYDPETQNGFAIDSNDTAWMAFTSAGKIVIGKIDADNNSNDYLFRSPPQESSPWMEFGMSGASCFKPSLVVGKNNEIFVGFHAVKNNMVSTYFMVSYDNGNTWQPPQLVTKSTWRFSSLSKDSNGSGLREGIDVSPDGKIYYTYADDRNGKLLTYVAIIDLGADVNISSQLTRN